MNKKLFVFTFALLVSINTFFLSQTRPPQGNRVKLYSERLKLNDQQTKVVDSIITASEKEFLLSSTEDRTQRREEMRKIMDKVNKQIESILTPEQDSLFQKMIVERRNRMNSQGQGAHEKPTN